MAKIQQVSDSMNEHAKYISLFQAPINIYKQGNDPVGKPRPQATQEQKFVPAYFARSQCWQK